jgi:hypothetical protein
MVKQKNKTPDELVSNFERTPLSTRVKTKTRTSLEKEAKRLKTSLSDLAAGILDDYVQWLNEEQLKNRK